MGLNQQWIRIESATPREVKRTYSVSVRRASSPFASRGQMRHRRARRRTGGPRDRFEEVLERTHGGLIVE